MRSVARTRSWAEHWSRPEAGLDERFEQQVADDVVPLLESLGVSVRGVPMSHPSEENRVVSVAIEGGGTDRPQVLSPGALEPGRTARGGAIPR